MLGWKCWGSRKLTLDRSGRQFNNCSYQTYFINLAVLRDFRIIALTALRSTIASAVNRPCFKAFELPFGAPEPAAPPCMRHRILPETAGAWQGAPERVRAPQRGLVSIGPVLRG
jgi:hypothetical protein